MFVPNSEEILSVSPDGVAEFIMKHAGDKTLSRIVQRLNSDLLEGNESASQMAARALDHLGFMIQD
jgi:hypothetical protein